mmetsp:Transcript_8912/g.23540  ORF Transcript_8912/g.23540 Transcript_8912/m.23540 type:complete len:274 (+) Transcript_8912:598-1419(+)
MFSKAFAGQAAGVEGPAGRTHGHLEEICRFILHIGQHPLGDRHAVQCKEEGWNRAQQEVEPFRWTLALHGHIEHDVVPTIEPCGLRHVLRPELTIPEQGQVSEIHPDPSEKPHGLVAHEELDVTRPQLPSARDAEKPPEEAQEVHQPDHGAAAHGVAADILAERILGANPVDQQTEAEEDRRNTNHHHCSPQGHTQEDRNVVVHLGLDLFCLAHWCRTTNHPAQTKYAACPPLHWRCHGRPFALGASRRARWNPRGKGQIVGVLPRGEAPAAA